MTLIISRTLTDIARDVNREHGLVETHVANATQHAIACGRLLHEAKDRAGHGNWLAWLHEHFESSERTAENYMRLAANPQRVADLSMRENLKLLATPADPKPRNEPEPRPDPASLGGRLVAALNPSPGDELIVDAEVVEDREPPPALARLDQAKWRTAIGRTTSINASLTESSQQHLAPESVAGLLEDAAREARFLAGELQQLANAFRRTAA